MKYFWHIFALIIGVTAVTFLFFALSVRVKNNVNFTGGTATKSAPEITSADPSIGPLNAAVTIVDYGDYQCPACADLEANLKTLQGTYGTSLRIVWKDMPNSSSHPEAINAAVAARCAEKQKQFWGYHALLMANQSLLGHDFYLDAASTLKLKASTFSQCLTNQDTLPLVQRGYDEGIALQITATPTIFINNERYTGDLSLADLKHSVEAQLH
jgi:protein-disulfide isomerase